MGKEFKRKYMHPTRRKLVDMVKTGEYAKNTLIGWTKKEESHQIGDIWEDEHHRYEKKNGYILKTSKNSEALQEIRDYIAQRTQCKSETCKTIKKSDKDRKLIEKTGYCIGCLTEIQHEVRTAGFWKEYEDYKVYTNMIIYGKTKLEELNQSLSEVKPYYEYVNEDGTTEKWELPKPIDEVKAEIQEMIDNGEKEIKEVEEKRIECFNTLKTNNLEHYL